MARKDPIVWPAGRPYEMGDLYSFRTSPATMFSPAETGRYAAFKILGFKSRSVCVAVLDGIFARHPDLASLRDLPILRETRFNYDGAPASFFVRSDREAHLEDLRHAGKDPISDADKQNLEQCRTYADWTRANVAAEGEWRWKNDRAVYEIEVRREQAEFLSRVAAAQKRD